MLAPLSPPSSRTTPAPRRRPPSSSLVWCFLRLHPHHHAASYIWPGGRPPLAGGRLEYVLIILPHTIQPRCKQEGRRSGSSPVVLVRRGRRRLLRFSGGPFYFFRFSPLRKGGAVCPNLWPFPHPFDGAGAPPAIPPPRGPRGVFPPGEGRPREKNPPPPFSDLIFPPGIDFVIKWRRSVITGAGVVFIWVFLPWNRLVGDPPAEGQPKTLGEPMGKAFPYQNIGSEFMPPLYEGDLLYMPTTFPGISSTKARELLQQTDKIIKTFPEVHHVFGKVGRAETATDPAPFDMIETTIMLKDEWPKVDIKDDSGNVIAHRRRSVDELVDALNSAIQFPGLANAWTMPIKTRIDMLSTGIKTPVGIKIAGPDLAELERIGSEVEAVVKQVPGTTSAYSERVIGGRYLEFDINRDEIARYGLTQAEVQEVSGRGAGRHADRHDGRGIGTLHHQPSLRP